MKIGDFPDPPSAQRPAADRARWVQQRLRPSARYLAVLEIFEAVPAGEGGEEIATAAIMLAARVNLGLDTADRIADFEWRAALKFAVTVSDALRRRIWPLGRAEAPGEEIMIAAQAVLDHGDAYVPRPALLERVRRIAHAARRPPKRRMRR